MQSVFLHLSLSRPSTVNPTFEEVVSGQVHTGPCVDVNAIVAVSRGLQPWLQAFRIVSLSPYAWVVRKK